jgi:hypothetical protein
VGEAWAESPRLAGVRALARVVTTAVIQAGARLPSRAAAWHAIAVSRAIAEAGTGAPVADRAGPQPAAASADATAAAPAGTSPRRHRAGSPERVQACSSAVSD